MDWVVTQYVHGAVHASHAELMFSIRNQVPLAWLQISGGLRSGRVHQLARLRASPG